MDEGTRTTMDDDKLNDEVSCVFDDMSLLSKRLATVEHRLRLCDWELAKTDRRRRWDDSELLRPPRKMPLNDNFLHNNNPLQGLRDDRDHQNPEQRLRPPSTHDPWLGQVDAYAHELTWTNGPWERQVTPNRGPTWCQWRIEPIDEHR